MQRHAIDVDMFAQDVAGGAFDLSDDSGFPLGQGIEQAGFAGIGTSGNHHGHPFAQQRTLVGIADDASQVGVDNFKIPRHFAVTQEIDLFFRKIDSRFHIHAQSDQFIHKSMHVLGKRAL